MRTLPLLFILVEVPLSHAGLVMHPRRDGGGDHDGREKREAIGLLSSILGTLGDPATTITRTSASPTPTSPLSTPPSPPPSSTPSSPPPSEPSSNPTSSSPSPPFTPTNSHISSLNLSGTSKIPQASVSPTAPSSASVPPTIAADATEAPTNTPAPSTISLSAGSKHTSHASLIAGILVPLLIITLAAALFVIHRRRRRSARPNRAFDGAIQKRDADPPPPGASAPAPAPDAVCEDEEYSSKGCDSDSADSLPVLSEKDPGTALQSNGSAVSSSGGATAGDSPIARGRTSHALSRSPTFASHWSRETALPPYVRPLPTIPPLSTMPPLPPLPAIPPM
ncbi:hypothetical protein MVEN_02393400 [Mycena venus]|uniref:Uncharacterized protein n=1 Tax=Mycena venus TaxID=2733690 RepID=A0A8H6X2J2_9AGAR|nr:hypothetical protein MVEN_02393400 [Mycena venus]